MQSQHTLDDLIAQRKTILEAMSLPNIPADELEIYQDTLASIEAQISAIRSTNSPQNSRPENERTKPQSPEFTARTGAGSILAGNTGNAMGQGIPSRTINAGGHAQTTQPITSKIELANDSDRFNPTIIITWSDGYSLPVDETAATGRFKSTLRDTLALKCVSEGRLAKMWRWDTPWRCAGFYKAITAMREGIPPTLKELGYTHPSEMQRTVFGLITEHALLETEKTTE